MTGSLLTMRSESEAKKWYFFLITRAIHMMLVNLAIIFNAVKRNNEKVSYLSFKRFGNQDHTAMMELTIVLQTRDKQRQCQGKQCTSFACFADCIQIA